ncbi:MAG: hypothetical protein IT314_08320 [Anaerolineales bacterium]|nr:hypothetical protein [Anaerolineales bacterium]
MKNKILSSALMVVVLFAGCASPQATTEAPPVIAPSATSQPTATASPIPPSPTFTPTPKTTGVTIDGSASDWETYDRVANDATGDQVAGSPDLGELRAFNNDQNFYVMIRENETGKTDHYDILMDVNGGDFDFQISVWPERNEAVFAAFPTSGDMTPVDGVTSARGDVIEIRMALSVVGGKPVKSFLAQTWLGDQVGDVAEPAQVVAINELEPTPIPGSQPRPLPTRVDFTAEDGQALVGYFYASWQSNAPVVMLVHQYGVPQNNWVDYGMVDWLQNWPPDGAAHGLFPAMPVDQSFAVFTLDLRGFGESGPPIPKNASDEEYNKYAAGWIQDVKAALDHVKTLPGVDASRIAIIGANNGADVSVVSCGDCLGVLALSPGNYVDEDFKATVETLDAKGKIVWCFSTEKSAGTDVVTCGSVASAHYNWINFPGDGRGMQLIREDKAPADVGQNILDFLSTVFGFTP